MVLSDLTAKNRPSAGPWLVVIALALLVIGCGQKSAPPEQESGIISTVPSIGALAGTPDPIVPPVPTLSPESVALGKRIYDEHCAGCHGAALEGEVNWQRQNEDGSFRAPPHDASGHTWHHADPVLIDSVARGGERLPAGIGGTSPMPTFAELLSEDEIVAALDFIKSAWPEDIRALQWEVTVRSRAVE